VAAGVDAVSDMVPTRKRLASCGAAIPTIVAISASLCLAAPLAAQDAPAPREGSADAALTAFLVAAHPEFENVSWTVADWDGAPVTARLPDRHALAQGPRPDPDAPVRLAPDVSATGLSLDLPWRDTRIASARAHLVGDYMVLEGFTLANAAGTLGADALILSQDALRVLGTAVAGGATGASAPADVVFDGLAIEVRRAAPDGSSREFASRFSAARLTLLGLTADVAEEDGPPTLDLAGLDGVGLSGAARFAGSAEFTLDALAFRGSPRALTQAAQAVIRLAEAPTGEDARAASLSITGFSFRARRPGSDPAVFDIAEASIRANFGEAASRLAIVVDDLRASVALLAGTPAEATARTIAANATAATGAPDSEGGPFLRLDLEADAAMREDRLRLRLACLAAPGVVDLATEIDVTLPEGTDLSALDPRALLGARVRGLSLAAVDHGLGALLRAATGSSVSELVEAAATRVLERGIGIPAPVARLTLPPLVSAVATFDEEGSLAAQAPLAAPAPLALAAFLSSAAPVAPGSEALAGCGARP